MTNHRSLALLLGIVLAGLPFVPGCRREEPAPITAGSSLYQCSMHPQIVSREPGTCPICGMKLTPVEETKSAAAAESGVPGRAGFALSPERQQLIGVTRGRVEERRVLHVRLLVPERARE